MNEAKFCTICKTEYPATNEYYYKDKTRKDGLCCACKNCHKEYNLKDKEHISQNKKEYRAKNIVHILQQKKEYSVQHKEQISQHRKEYYAEHKEQNLQYAKEYHTKNREHRLQYNKEYYFNHKEYRLQYKKDYQKTENGQLLHSYYRQKRRAVEKSLPATLTVTQWKDIKTFFDNRCAYCGEEKPLQQEHFIALSKKGEYTQNNIIPACKNCNSSKHNASFFTWYPSQKFYKKTREKKILKFLNYHKQNQQLRLFISI